MYIDCGFNQTTVSTGFLSVQYLGRKFPTYQGKWTQRNHNPPEKTGEVWGNVNVCFIAVEPKSHAKPG